jgi:hypothetical protein
MKSLTLLSSTLLIWLNVYSQEYGRIIEHRTSYILQDNLTAEIHEYYKLQINSKEGNSFAIYQDYIDKFRKIEDVTIEIFDANGKRVKKLSKSQGREFGFNQSYEITDGKIFVMKPDYKQYPFTITVESRIKLLGFISLPTWIPQPKFNLSVDHSVLTIQRPESMKINIKEENINGKTETSKGSVISYYEVAQLKHVDSKIRFKDFYDSQIKVFVTTDKFKLDNSIGSCASWIDFGNWFISLNDFPFKLTKETKSFIDNLNLNDTISVIRNIYEYMQDKTRYVSIQLGIGGFKSLATEEVEKNGYGDCKALTTYTKNMLEYAGISSNYILVKAGKDMPDIAIDFPSNQFNHVFLGIPLQSDTIYLECTSQLLPAGHTGQFTDDRHVLWIAKNKSKIIRSTTYDHNANIQSSIVKISLTETGSASAQVNITNSGLFFDELMIYKMAPTDYISEYNQRKFTYNDYTIRNFKYHDPSRSDAVFNSTFNLDINGLANAYNTGLVFPIVPTNPFHYYLELDHMMKYFTVKKGITIHEVVEVSLPQGYWIYNLPENVETESRFGKYKLEIDFSGKEVIIKRDIVLYKGDYLHEDYDQFNDFYQKLGRWESKKLILNPKT